MDKPTTQKQAEDDARLRGRMRKIQKKIVVLSGKGGVGKSTVATNIAVSLSVTGRKVGLLDVDVHGPSVPYLLGIHDRRLMSDGEQLEPVHLNENLAVMSVGFLLENRDSAVIWRGPMKYNVIKQFLRDVNWGELDFLVVDSPPGTGDEPLSVIQLMEDPTGAIIVTTPQDVALNDVRKSITFCRQLNLPVLGVVENMSGFVCPHCGTKTDIFKVGGGRAMALEMGVPFLGSIPLNASIAAVSDEGRPCVGASGDGDISRVFEDIAGSLKGIKS